MIAWAQYDVHMSIWWEYVVRIAKTEVQKKMAADTGISETAFSRWKNGTNKPEAPHVIAFARAYGRPAVEALVAADILSADDAGQAIEIHRGVDDFTDSELLEAIGLRMKGLRNALEVTKEQAASSKAPAHEKTGADSADDVKPSSAAAAADAITAAAVAELEVDGVDNNREQA